MYLQVFEKNKFNEEIFTVVHVSKVNNLQLLGPMYLSRNHCIRNT